MVEHTGAGFDGTRLRYWTRRSGPNWLLICTGYGGTLAAWEPLLACLDPAWSLLLWDYRGQFGSEAPMGGLPIEIGDHSRDLETLLEKEGVERGVLMGWSVGVQVALEHYRRRAETVQALVLINGAYERVLHAPLGPGVGAHIVRGLTHLLAGMGPTLQPALRPLFGKRALPRAGRAIGLITGNVDGFSRALQAWQGLDLGLYMQMTLWADAHTTSEMLGSVEVPTLITCGDKDIVTPPVLAHQLHALIPGSELLEIPNSTHYSIIEKPAFVAHSIELFLERTQLGRQG